jgi:hypothetical protein
VHIHSRVTSQASYSPEYITPTQKKYRCYPVLYIVYRSVTQA